MKTSTLFAIACLLAAPLAAADAPAWIPVQAYLTDADGNPLSGQHEIDLSVYDSASGGNALFSEAHTTMVDNGLVTLYLGDNQPLDLGLFRDNQELFLGVEVDSDGEMSPRFTLGAVPYAGFAQHAGDAQTLQGLSPAAFRATANPVAWANLGGIPAGVGDGDDDTLAGMGCAEGNVAKFIAGFWQCAQDESGMGVHTHDGADITSPVAVAQSANAAPWSGLSGVPAGFADGVDNVGSGLDGSGTVNSLALFSAADAVGDSVVVQDGVNIGIHKTPADKLDVNGITRATAFRSNAGSVLVAPGATETVGLTFTRRSVYVVKASWTGGMMEGTRAWFVLTHHDMNNLTGQPTIIEIGMTSGSYHYSDTLNLTQDGSLANNQLLLSCNRSHGNDSRSCYWSISNLSYH